MNVKERAVLLFLIAVLIAGAGASAWRHYRLQRNLKAVRIEIAKDSTAVRSSEPAPRRESGFPAATPVLGDSSNARPLESSSPLMDLNSAPAAELDLLPGIGPALAQRIIEYRTKHGRFKTIEELKQVSGIGPKKFEAIRDHVMVTR